MKDAVEICNDYIKANEFINDFKSKQTSFIQKMKSDFDGIICALENRRDSFEASIKKHLEEFDSTTKKQRKVLDDLLEKQKKGKAVKKLEDANDCLKSYLDDVSKIGLFLKEVDDALNRFTVGFDLYFQPGVPPSRMLAEDEAPKGWMEQKDPSSGFTFFYNVKDTKAQWEFPSDKPLPNGWAELKDISSGKSYYHNTVRHFSQWKRPTTADSETTQVIPMATNTTNTTTNTTNNITLTTQPTQLTQSATPTITIATPSTPGVTIATPATPGGLAGSSTPSPLHSAVSPTPLTSSSSLSSPQMQGSQLRTEWGKSALSGSQTQPMNTVQKGSPVPSHSQPSPGLMSPNQLTPSSSPAPQQVQQQQQQQIQQQPQQQQVQQQQIQQPIQVQPNLIPDTHFVRNEVQLPGDWGWYTYNKIFYYRNFTTKETLLVRPGWTKMFDNTKNRAYYGHNATKVTQWDPPEWYDEATHKPSPVNVFTGEQKS